MAYIRRAIEAHFLRMLGQYKAVLVTGARQVGKSTLLREICPDRPYVTLDDPWMEEQAREQASLFMGMHPAPVTIDEIQRAPSLFRYVKLRCDESEQFGQYCLSGLQTYPLMLIIT